MGVDLASLIIKVESQQVQSAQQGLDQLAKSGGTAEQAVSKLGSSSGAMGGAIASANGQILSMVGALTAMIGVTVSVAGAYALLKKNIDAISATGLSSIATAAMILSRSGVEGITEQKQAYAGYRAYVLNMYKELNAETDRHFASGKEMIGTFDAFAQKGIYAAKEEAGAIGVISDAIKLLRGGYTDQATAMHEIQGLLEGHAGIHFKLAQQLSTMIGPEWKKIVQDHIQDGTILTFLLDKYKGLAVANGDIQQILTAQQTTLDTLMSQVGKAGLAGMYEDIVGWVIQINQYLRVHKDELISKIASTWEGMRGTVYGVASGVGAITAALGKFAGQLDSISKNPAFMALFGAAAGSRFGPVGAVIGGAGGAAYAMQQRNYDEVARGLESGKRVQSGLIGYGSEGEGHVSSPTAIKAPPWQVPPLVPKGGGGGGGADAEIGRLNSLFDTLNKDIARLSEGKLSAIEADYVKTVEQIYKKTSDRAHSEAEVEILAKQRATLQKGKLQDDFDLKMAKGSGDAFLEINEQYKKDMLDYKGLAGAKEKLDAYYGRQRVIKEVELASELLTLQKTNVDAMAGLAPMLEDQLALKRESLALENQLAQAAITKLIAEKPYLKHLEDELKLQQAMVIQAKKYALEREGWMKEGVSGGLKAGSYDRGKESDTRTATWMIEAMKGAETWLGDTGGQAFVDALHGKKGSLTAMFSNLGDSLVKQIWKMGATKLFDSIWSGIGGALGGKGIGQLGASSQNPMWVTFDGIGAKSIGGLGGGGTPDYATTASKIGYTTGTKSAFGGEEDSLSPQISQLGAYSKLWKQFYKDKAKWMKTEDKSEDKDYKEDTKQLMKFWKESEAMTVGYQDAFTGMTTNVTGVWGAAQGIMTAAGAEGEAQRVMAVASYGAQGIGIISMLAKSAILINAAQAASATYSSVAQIPYVGWILAPIAAAVAFAAVAAYGAFGGSVGGGGGASATMSSAANSPMTGSAGGDYQVGETGPRYIHQGETVLPVWAAESWRNIVSRENTGGRPGEGGGEHYYDNRQIDLSIGDIKTNLTQAQMGKLLDRQRNKLFTILKEEKRNFRGGGTL